MIALQKMNQSELQETWDTLETFLLLKQQNLLIYAWMQLKKRSKRVGSLRGSRSIYQPSASSSRPMAPQHIHSTPKIIRKDVRLATQNYTPNEDAFGTFHKQQGNRFTLTEKFTSRNHPREAVHTQNQQAEMQDSEEFEDIVLDRLSKLEENINRLMREKKLKEQQRGYVGTPLHHPQPQYFHTQQQEAPANIQERRKRFFESLNHPQQQNAGRDIVYNLKYIPVQQPNHSNAHIHNIRRIFQTSDEDNFMDNVDYFITANPRRAEGWEEKENGESRGRGSSSLYMQRYERRGDSRVHYVPSHLEMQTVIEPRKRYFHRHSFDSNHSGRDHIKIEEEMKRSNVSRNSEYSAKANNLSAYY